MHVAVRKSKAGIFSLLLSTLFYFNLRYIFKIFLKKIQFLSCILLCECRCLWDLEESIGAFGAEVTSSGCELVNVAAGNQI